MAFVHPYKVEDGGIRRDEAVQVWGNDKEKGARAKGKQGRGKGRVGEKDEKAAKGGRETCDS